MTKLKVVNKGGVKPPTVGLNKKRPVGPKSRRGSTPAKTPTKGKPANKFIKVR